MDDHTFHAGELAVQQRAGQRHIAEQRTGMVSATVMAGARPFIAGQFMVVLASADSAGRMWSSLLFGQPGFAHAEGDAVLIEAPAAARDAADPLWANLVVGGQLGMLFIDLGKRRRYRVNGVVRHLNGRHVEVDVREAYPNCPQYIQRRQLRQRSDPRLPVQAELAVRGTTLGGTVAEIVRQADTVFVASHHADSGADASHRGGNRGFVQLLDDSTLRIPDYHGNSLFNTLGNFAVDPHAGLIIPDFEQGRLLQLTGTVTLQWHELAPGHLDGDTGRSLDFKVEQWLLRDMPLALEWEYLDASPFNPSIVQKV